MSCFYSAVTEQRVFICAVYAFIGKLLRAVLPEVAWDNTYLPAEDEFGGALDAVIQKHDFKTSCEGDCCLAMAQMACKKMKRVCDLLKRVSESVGLKDEAKKYLDAPWFVDLLLRKDTSKLNKLYYTIDFDDEKPSRILMNVAAILNDDAVAYDSMTRKAKRKADTETKELIKQVGERVEKKLDEHKAEITKHIDAVGTNVETLREELHETKDELLAKADAIIKKLGKVNLDGKRNRSHTPEQRKVVLACWLMAKDDLRDSTSGVVTKRMAYERYRHVLEDVGIKTFAKFDAVIHFAGLKAVGESVEQPLRYYENNIQGTINLLKAMREAGVSKLVFSSSATVYGDKGADSAQLVETMTTGVGVTNPYGWTKAMIEQIIRDVAVSDAEFSATILRYFNPVGADKSGLIGEDPNGIPNNLMPIVTKVYQGGLPELVIYGDNYETEDGSCERDFIHVTDLAKGHLAALEHMKPGVSVYNLGSGKATSVFEIVNAFEKISGQALPKRIGERRAGDLAVVCANPSLAQEELGWKTELSVEDAIRDTLRFLDNLG